MAENRPRRGTRLIYAVRYIKRGLANTDVGYSGGSGREKNLRWLSPTPLGRILRPSSLPPPSQSPSIVKGIHSWRQCRHRLHLAFDQSGWLTCQFFGTTTMAGQSSTIPT